MQTPNILSAHRIQAAALLTALLFPCARMGATPILVGPSKGTTQFAKNTVITVYVPVDPTGNNRQVPLTAGILSWNNERPLISNGIQIKVMAGQEPAGATNAVQVNWVAPTSGDELGEANTTGTTTPTSNTTTGGTIDIDPDTTQVNNTEAQNLGIHEMGHILGLADTPNTGNAMDPNFTGTSLIKITDEDTLELFSTFAASNGPASDAITSVVTYADGLYQYKYTLTYESGLDLALFQVDADEADLQDITVPQGWSVDPSNGADVTTDFTGTTESDQFVSFVLTDETSYLGPNDPVLNFSFESTQAPGDVQAFLSGYVETTGPVTIPEPGCFALTASGLMALILLKGRSRQLNGRSAGVSRRIRPPVNSVRGVLSLAKTVSEPVVTPIKLGISTSPEMD